MANGRNKYSKGDLGRDSGGFVALPWAVMDCPAYAALSHPARSLLAEVARQFVRDNNGRMLLSAAYLSERGWKSADVITRAKRELIAAGFIFETALGHRPNKASWYAVTWRALDQCKGYDDGAAASFVRGAYKTATITPKATRQQLYEKWRDSGANKNGPASKKSPQKITSLRPSGGVESTAIAPSGGVETIPIAPSGGAIDPLFAPLSTPSHGNHLDIPSIAVVEPTAFRATIAPPTTPTKPARETLHLKHKPPPATSISEDVPFVELVTRHRDCDTLAQHFDTNTGVYRPPPPAPTRRHAEAVNDALSELCGIYDRRMETEE